MLDTTVSDHRQIDAWGGYTEYGSRFGVRCQCGIAFDGFDTVAEAVALLDRHIAAETAPDPWTEAADALERVAAGLRSLARLELPAPSIAVIVQPHGDDTDVQVTVNAVAEVFDGKAATREMGNGTYQHITFLPDQDQVHMKVGPVEVRAYGGVKAPEPLTVHEAYAEKVGPFRGREIRAHWGRRLDTGVEGWMSFGPGGQFSVETSGGAS